MKNILKPTVGFVSSFLFVKYVLVYFCKFIDVFMYQQEGKCIYCCPCNMFYTFSKNNTFQHSFLYWAVHIWDVKQETLFVLNVLNSKNRNYLIVYFWKGVYVFYLRDKINF